jgi:flagella basal body P-ring formation protein FlgA
MIGRIALALIVLLPLGTAAAQASELDRPRLKAEAVVTGSVVRVGDLVENAGIIAEVPIFRSPDLGATGSISAEAVIKAVSAHALVGLDPRGIRQVVVTRAARTIDPQEIEHSITAALSAQYALGTPADIALDLDRNPGPLHVEPTVKGEPRVARIDYTARTARFTAAVDIPGHGLLYLSGHARATVDVVVVIRSVTRGEILKQADVVVERKPRAEMPRGIISDGAEAIGLAARNNMQPGRLLRARDLMKPQIVQRNEAVTLIYRMPGIMLTVRGKALERGADGDTISVLNEQSKRTLQGVVVGPGRILISNHTAQVAANIPPAHATFANPR